LVEPVGSELYVNAATGVTSWLARAEARLPVRPGQPVSLRLNLAHAHLFGPEGRNLGR
jgi:hypothetical protein